MDGISGALITGAPLAPDNTGVSKAGRIDRSPLDATAQSGLRGEQGHIGRGDRVSPRPDHPGDGRGSKGRSNDVVALSPSGRAAARDAAVVSLYPVGRVGPIHDDHGDQLTPAPDTPQGPDGPSDRVDRGGLSQPTHSAGPHPTADHHPGEERGHEEADPPSQSHATELSPDEQRQVKALATRDREVRAHEQAHKAAGGQHTGAISLSYTTGPDGRRYATSGEVPVDLSPIPGDPEATIRKLDQIARAALAPADPSSADRRVAARAARLVRKAQREVLEEAMREENTDPRPGAQASANVSAESAVEENSGERKAAEKAPKSDASAKTAEALTRSDAVKEIVGNPHHRPPSVSPDAQVPVRLNLSVYA